MKNLNDILEGFFDNVNANGISQDRIEKDLEDIIKKHGIKLINGTIHCNDIEADTILCSKVNTNSISTRKNGHDYKIFVPVDSATTIDDTKNYQWATIENFTYYSIDISVWYDDNASRPRYTIKVKFHRTGYGRGKFDFEPDYHYQWACKKVMMEYYDLVLGQFNDILDMTNKNYKLFKDYHAKLVSKGKHEGEPDMNKIFNSTYIKLMKKIF